MTHRWRTRGLVGQLASDVSTVLEKKQWLTLISGNSFQPSDVKNFKWIMISFSIPGQNKTSIRNVLDSAVHTTDYNYTPMGHFFFPVRITGNRIYQNCCVWRAQTGDRMSENIWVFCNCNTSAYVLADLMRFGLTMSGSFIWNRTQNSHRQWNGLQVF